MSDSARRRSPKSARPGPGRSFPQASVSWETSTTSWSPSRASASTSATTSARGRLRWRPRMSGIAQKVQPMLHPSAIFTYAYGTRLWRRRGVSARYTYPGGAPATHDSRASSRRTTSTIRGRSPVPRMASTSGSSVRSPAPYRWGRQPVTTRRRPGASAFQAASSRIVSIDSRLARSMNAHVFTTTQSAAAGRSTGATPSRASSPSISSPSTWFLGHPRFTRWTFMARRGV